MIKNFKEYIKKDNEVRNFKTKTLKLIQQFIHYNNKFKEKHFLGIGSNKNIPIDFFIQNNHLIVKLLNSHFLEFTQEEFKELKKFIKNPQLYIDTNKYNL